MAYDITCQNCGKITYASDIVDLIQHHIDPFGYLVCSSCGGTNTFIFRQSNLQEKGGIWKRYIKLVIPINTGIETYSPYIFAASDEENSPINQFHFNYYKDTRSRHGKLKHGHGPGGAPVLSKEELFQLLRHLAKIGLITRSDINSLAVGLPVRG